MKFAAMFATAAVLAAVPAAAQFTTYNDRGVFNAAAGAISTEDFQSCTGTTGVIGTLSASNPGNCTSLLGGISYAPDPGFDLYIAGPGQSANATTALGVNFPTGGNNRISFAGGTTAFGGDFNQNFGGGSQNGGLAFFTVDVFDLGGTLLNTFNFDVASGTTVFFGLTSTTGFGSVWVRQLDGYAVIDNVSFTGGGVVPEPASWAMLIAGFGLVGAVSRRRRAAIA